jgi:hypothetical protein
LKSKEDPPGPAPPIDVDPYTYHESDPYSVDASTVLYTDATLSFSAKIPAALLESDKFFGQALL